MGPSGRPNCKIIAGEHHQAEPSVSVSSKDESEEKTVPCRPRVAVQSICVSRWLLADSGRSDDNKKIIIQHKRTRLCTAKID